MSDNQPMTNTDNTTSLDLLAAPSPRPQDVSMHLAHYVRYCRQEIELSVPEAASRAGFDARDWWAIEGGWIPAENDYRLHAIADALGVGWIQVDFGAALTRAQAAHDAAL
jgi:hypothetical protein